MESSLTELKRNAPTDARQVRSRNALTGALLALLAEKSFDQLTIREITAKAGTGYATFFRHYPTKEALLADVASSQITDLLARAMPVLYAQNSYESTRALCLHVSEHASLWSALLNGGAASLVREEFIRQAHGLANDAKPANDWLPADLGVSHGTGSTVDILGWWLAQKKEDGKTPPSAEDVAKILHRLVIGPLIGDIIERRTPQA